MEMGTNIVILWHKLGDKQANFIPNMIGQFLEITLLKETSMELFF